MKKLCLLISMMAIAVMLTGCYSREEKQYMESLKKQAEKNSIVYVKNKYDINAKVVNSVCEKQKVSVVPDFSPPPTGNVYVTLSCGGDEFHVLISGEDVTDEGYDDYQYKDIEKYIQNAIEESISEDILSLYMEYGQPSSHYHHFVREYFDETNIQDILKDVNIRKIVVGYIGEDSSSKDIRSLVGYQTTVMFVNYRDEKSYNLLSEKERQFHLLNYEIERVALAISDYTICNNTDGWYVKFNLWEQEDIYCITADGTYCDIIESEIDSPSKFDEQGNKNSYQLTKAYRIYTDASKVYVFADKGKLEDKLEDNYGYFALQYIDNGYTQHTRLLTYSSCNDTFITGSIPVSRYRNPVVSIFADRK